MHLLKSSKTFITIDKILSDEPVMQYRVFQQKKHIDAQKVFRHHLQIALKRGRNYGIHVGHLSYRQAVLTPVRICLIIFIFIGLVIFSEIHQFFLRPVPKIGTEAIEKQYAYTMREQLFRRRFLAVCLRLIGANFCLPLSLSSEHFYAMMIDKINLHESVTDTTSTAGYFVLNLQFQFFKYQSIHCI